MNPILYYPCNYQYKIYRETMEINDKKIQQKLMQSFKDINKVHKMKMIEKMNEINQKPLKPVKDKKHKKRK